MRILAWAIGVVLLMMMSGCTQDEGPDLTIPPISPSHKIEGSVFPLRVAGYTVLGSTPVPLQMTATYARDNAPLDLAVVTFDPAGEFRQVSMSDQQWYRASRCGTMWKSDAKTTPQPKQVACITVLTDGVMTTVSGGQQTAEDLSDLANAIYDQLAST